MERGSIRALVMVGLVMGMLVGQSTASFKDCYTKCFIFCIITPNNTAFSCSLECLKDCVIPSHPLDIETADTTYFCKLGCASTLCTNLSTKKNPGNKSSFFLILSYTFHSSILLSLMVFGFCVSRRESGKLCEFLLKQMHRVPPISFKDTAIQSSKALIIFQLYCDRVCLKK